MKRDVDVINTQNPNRRIQLAGKVAQEYTVTELLTPELSQFSWMPDTG